MPDLSSPRDVYQGNLLGLEGKEQRHVNKQPIKQKKRTL